ncbi:hypothetical protein QFC21_002608 [Naganishia friedmannii]|uniref:Uncharacterized protein n=1 Tax=Naganishia friedmannii TaxID=89922 RepID=A0ACC2VWF2_9TREE|nr:hypothetical protein QFC21_002608 [Naganishia friedmannii]
MKNESQQSEFLPKEEPKSDLRERLDDILETPDEKKGLRIFLRKAWWEGGIVDEEEWAAVSQLQTKYEILQKRLETAAMAWALKEARKAGGTVREEEYEDDSLREEELGHATQSFLDTLLLERVTLPKDVLEILSTLMDQKDDVSETARGMSDMGSAPLGITGSSLPVDTPTEWWGSSIIDSIRNGSRNFSKQAGVTGHADKDKAD